MEDVDEFFGFFAIFTSAMLTFLRWEFERTFLSTIQPVVEVSRNGRQVAFVDLNFHQKISKQISSETKQILKEFCIVTCWMLEKNMSRIFRYQISIFKVVWCFHFGKQHVEKCDITSKIICCYLFRKSEK